MKNLNADTYVRVACKYEDRASCRDVPETAFLKFKPRL